MRVNVETQFLPTASHYLSDIIGAHLPRTRSEFSELRGTFAGVLVIWPLRSHLILPALQQSVAHTILSKIELGLDSSIIELLASGGGLRGIVIVGQKRR
ncbi:hypothetical protein PMIN06_004399 [Paraphaeosphaeria minitans]